VLHIYAPLAGVSAVVLKQILFRCLFQGGVSLPPAEAASTEQGSELAAKFNLTAEKLSVDRGSAIGIAARCRVLENHICGSVERFPQKLGERVRHTGHLLQHFLLCLKVRYTIQQSNEIQLL
jgi:hypothetical protein